MAMEIFLKRPHVEIPWGFRIIGGSDSHLPIIVSKVLENSIAESCGLEEDVLIEKINNIPTSGLTHYEVNQIIISADTELLFRIRRENLENLILASLNDSENHSEITSALRQAVSSKITEEQIEYTDDNELGLKREFGMIVGLDNNNNNVNNENRIFINSDKNQPQRLNSCNQPVKKKWSTFLQKPRNPLPTPKNQPPPIPKTERYKVIITKQPKKIVPEQVLEPEEPQVNTKKKCLDSAEIESEYQIKELDKLESDIGTDITEEFETTETKIQSEEPEVESEYFEMKQEDSDDEFQQIEQEIERDSSENVDLDHSIEKIEQAPSLEEQLAAIQRQLQELSQFPSAIQDTLAVVTQQLANIVGEPKEPVEDNAENQEMAEEESESEMKEEIRIEDSEDENVESERTEENASDERSEYLEVKDPLSEALSDICEEEELSENVEAEVDEETIKRQIEEQQIMEEKLLKQKTQDEENIAKKSVIRPIILPGGRKWVDPDDAVMKIKNTRMTDDKICNTLETFSEVIIGKTKGINFLKYTPPPKNLDYLQGSEVYRLVHGMEPPVKGISLRSEKILAEQDYYTAGGN